MNISSQIIIEANNITKRKKQSFQPINHVWHSSLMNAYTAMFILSTSLCLVIIINF